MRECNEFLYVFQNLTDAEIDSKIIQLKRALVQKIQ